LIEDRENHLRADDSKAGSDDLLAVTGRLQFEQFRIAPAARQQLVVRADRFDFTVGQPIDPEALDGDLSDVTRLLEQHTVHDLAADPDARFGA
jgi:hypothetical protein